MLSLVQLLQQFHRNCRFVPVVQDNLFLYDTVNLPEPLVLRPAAVIMQNLLSFNSELI